MKPSITIEAAGKSWPFRWPARQGAYVSLIRRLELVEAPPKLDEDASDAVRSEQANAWIDYSDALGGLRLGLLLEPGELESLALADPPVSQPGKDDYVAPGPYWPLAKPGNANAYGIAIIDDLYRVGWTPAEIKEAIEAIEAAVQAWYGPRAAPAEVAAAREFSGASTAPTT